MKAKLGAIFLVSVLAIAGAGAAYALWFEDLYIYTDIETGDVDVRWTYNGYKIWQDKPVSTAEVSVTENIYHIWIYNAYPCIDYEFYFDLHCDGSIPVHFTPFTVLDNSNLPDGCYEYGVWIDWIVWVDGTTTTYDNIPIEYIQLHEGDAAYGTIWFHFNNNLPQDSDFMFDLTSRAHQYNELDWGPIG